MLDKLANDTPERLFTQFMTAFDTKKAAMVDIPHAGKAVVDAELFKTLTSEWKIDKRSRSEWLLYIAALIQSPQETWLKRLSHGEELYLFGRFMRGKERIDTMAVFKRIEPDGLWVGKTAYAFDGDNGINKKRTEVINSSVLRDIRV